MERRLETRRMARRQKEHDSLNHGNDDGVEKRRWCTDRIQTDGWPFRIMIKDGCNVRKDDGATLRRRRKNHLGEKKVVLDPSSG